MCVYVCCLCVLFVRVERHNKHDTTMIELGQLCTVCHSSVTLKVLVYALVFPAALQE